MPRITPGPSKDALRSDAIVRGDAAAELLRRRKARTNTLTFTQYVNPKYRPGAPHYKIAAELDMILRGENDRLMVFAPPRHGKTELGTRSFPAIYLGHHPNHEIMSAAFDAELADTFGRDVKAIVSGSAYKALFPKVALAEDSRAKGRWNTDEKGAYLSAGIGAQVGGGTGITGRGANLVTIDDPFKDRSSAESLAAREHVWNWYKSTVYTRLEPGGVIVLIQTRWHEDDLAGRLIEEEKNGGDKWRKLILSAADLDTGLPTPVWPEKYNAEALHRIMMALGGPNSRDWLSLYGQRPAPQSGALFDIASINIIDAAPPGTDVRAWDLAATRETGGRDPSYTAGVRLRKTLDQRYVIMDSVHFRGDPAEVERKILATAQQDGYNVRIGLPQDPGQAGKWQAQRLTSMLSGFKVESSPESGDKATRASPVIAQANVGNLSMVRGVWNRQFLEEMRVFPNGAHEDQVDALSRAGGMVMTNNGLDVWARLGALP